MVLIANTLLSRRYMVMGIQIGIPPYYYSHDIFIDYLLFVNLSTELYRFVTRDKRNKNEKKIPRIHAAPKGN